ncbi:MAG: HEAT repeat domain-containing protein [Coleofasciculus sp. B1-GNL1-01]|uniref:HEAT repeat domain-containing protein n=1 Tax=Coleofasciculus sp. B1-GNL1-01 TaxID=3068484 RepID=UPI0033000092
MDALTETIAAKQATFSFEQMVQTEEKRREEKPQIVSLPILKGIQNYVESEHILLVGSPGVGKSTALLRCLVSLAKKELEKPEPRIPVLVPLKRYNIRFSNSEDPSGILTLIRNALKPQLQLKIPEVEELLFQKRLILLLDGLNEMPADTVRTELKAFREECQDSEIPFICTTRELGSGDLGIKRRLEVQPLSPPEINRFLQECMPAQAEQILQLLSRDNRELSRTPFVLWMLYQLFQEKDTVVETLGEAFRQFFRSFKKYKEDAPVTDERRQAWNRWLEHLAFTMLNNPEPTDPGLIISDERAEKVLTERFGERYGTSSRIEDLLKYHLLERVSDREVSFHHQLIQEYYAAEYLLEYVPDLLRDEEGVKKLKCHYLNYLKWTEPIALMLGLLEINEETAKNQAIKIIDLALKVDLCLGARLAGEVKPDWQKETVGLIDVLNVPHSLKIHLYGMTRSEKVIPLLEQELVSENSSLHYRVIEALARVGNESTIPVLIKALEHKNYWLGSTVARVLGKIGSEKAIPNLRKALVGKNSHIRAAAASALGQIANPEAVPALLQALEDDNLEVRKNAASALAAINGEAVIQALVQHLKHQDFQVRKYAALALGKMGHEAAIPTLQQALEDWNSQTDVNPIIRIHDSFSSSAIFALAKIKAEDAVLTLVKVALEQNESFLRRIAIDNLKEIDHQVTIFSLLNALEVENCIIRSRAAEALGKIGSEEEIPYLLTAFENNFPCVRWSIAIALGEIGNKNTEVVSVLLHALKKKEDTDRWSAAIALGKLGIPEAIPTLREFLKYCSHENCYQVARALRQIGNQEAILTLLEALDDEDTEVCRIVAYELGQIGKSAIPALCEALKNKNPNIRASAARSLGRVGGEDEIPALLQALENQNHQIRASAAEALGEIGSKKVIPALFQAIEVKTPLDPLVVHPKVIEAIGKIWDSEELPQLNKLLLKPKITVRENLLTAIAGIQSRCGFYNYEIAQYSPPEFNITDKIENECIKIVNNMTNNFDQRGASIGVNVASEGSNIKFIQHAKQNINISEQDLAEAAQKIQALLNQLAQTYPPTSEPQQQTFIQKFLERLESTPDLIKFILAGGIERLKILCPPAGIPVEMARCLYEVVQKRYGQP